MAQRRRSTCRPGARPAREGVDPEHAEAESAATNVILLHRDDYYDTNERPEADLIAAKNRSDPRGLSVAAALHRSTSRNMPGAA